MNKRYYYLPLFWKFVIAIVLTVFIFGSINAYLIFQDVQKSLERESEKRVFYIGKSLSEQLVTPLLFEDYVGVQKLLDGTKSLDSTIVYVFITDKNNTLISGSSDINISTDLIKANNISYSANQKIRLIDFELNNHHFIVRDIAIPILGGELGQVRVGISEEKINEDNSNTVSHFWLMVGLFLIIGIFGAFMFSYLITNPIKKIQTAAENLALNSLESAEIPSITIRNKFFGKIFNFFVAEDEIDLLIQKFNQMISRLTSAYKELTEAEAQLIRSEKLATIGTVSAGLAHEINNPISGIKNCLRRMNKDILNIEQTKKYIKLMEHASTRIESVIKNLLNFTRLDEMKFEKVEIIEQIENALLLLAYRLETNRITITKIVPNKRLFVYGSKAHLEHVIVNLLANSTDAIEEVVSDTSHSIVISLEEKEDFIYLSVKDTGTGIPKEKLSKIFEPFFTTKATGKGTGLGLSIISNIVNSHNGKITVESKEGQGTIITVILQKYKSL